MSRESRIPLLLIGQLPPPWHGQAVATKIVFDHDWEGFGTRRLPMAYSSTLGSVGKWRLKKIWHLFELIFDARQMLRENPEAVVFYPPASSNWLPFLRDVLISVRRNLKYTFVTPLDAQKGNMTWQVV